jgi:DNA/RNA endonuclease YhcR with UshA esterase domain
MRLAAILLIAIFVPNLRAVDPPAKENPPAKPISVADAAKKVNEKVTVKMEVKSTGGRGPYFLNSEPDHTDDKNFTIFIPRDVVDKFKKAKIENPAEHYKGKTILVTGEVVLYHEKLEIKIEDPDQIKILPQRLAD